MATVIPDKIIYFFLRGGFGAWITTDKRNAHHPYIKRLGDAHVKGPWDQRPSSSSKERLPWVRCHGPTTMCLGPGPHHHHVPWSHMDHGAWARGQDRPGHLFACSSCLGGRSAWETEGVIFGIYWRFDANGANRYLIWSYMKPNQALYPSALALVLTTRTHGSAPTTPHASLLHPPSRPVERLLEKFMKWDL